MPEATSNGGIAEEGAGRPAIVGWSLIVLGLGAALVLLRLGQALAAAATTGSFAGDIVLFYVALFLPLALLSLVLGRLERRPVLRLGSRPGRWGAIGSGAGLGGLLTCVVYLWLHGSLRSAPPSADPGVSFLALGLAITVLTVGAEEMLFRGWLLPALAGRLSVWPAVLLSSVAFAAFHLIGGAVEPWSLVNLTLGGIWFALLALRSGGILAPFAAHYGWNVAEDLGLGLVPNPGRGEFGSLLDRDIVGPVLWGGSEEGINASIAMTLVLLALILPLVPRDARGA